MRIKAPTIATLKISMKCKTTRKPKNDRIPSYDLSSRKTLLGLV